MQVSVQEEKEDQQFTELKKLKKEVMQKRQDIEESQSMMQDQDDQY